MARAARKLFSVSSKADLAKLLAVAPGEIDYIISRLEYYYRERKIRKPGGNHRVLHVPHGKLKTLQRKILRRILDKTPYFRSVHGGVKGRSVVTNAQAHVGKGIVFCIDIEGFFPHVGPNRVIRIFQGLGFGEEPARILTRLTTWKYQLPQGSPTSTSLANLALIRVDVRIGELARKHRFSYTRYVDDIAVSGSWRLLKFRRLIQRIVRSEGFSIAPEKIETMHSGMRQVVTKLVVNSKLNLPRDKRSSIRRQVLDSISESDPALSPVSVQGQLAWLTYVNPKLGNKLLRRANTKSSSR